MCMCSSKHRILSLKTDGASGEVLKSPPIIGIVDSLLADNQIFSVSYNPLSQNAASSIDVSGAPQLNIPKELWRIVDYLYNHALYEEELFLRRGERS